MQGTLPPVPNTKPKVYTGFTDNNQVFWACGGGLSRGVAEARRRGWESSSTRASIPSLFASIPENSAMERTTQWRLQVFHHWQ